jgi:hypothetical protein
MVPELKASTYDVDQAFESCRNDTVVPGWIEVCKSYVGLFGGLPVLVKRGRRNQTRHGQKGFSRQWWSLSQEMLLRALVVTTTLTMVTLGSIVMVLNGLSIGGVMSAAAVAVRLASEELTARRSGGPVFGLVGKKEREMPCIGYDMWMMSWF